MSYKRIQLLSSNPIKLLSSSAIKTLGSDDGDKSMPEILKEKEIIIENYKIKNQELNKKANQLEKIIINKKIEECCKKLGVIDKAQEDVFQKSQHEFTLNESGDVQTRDGKTPEKWFLELKSKKSHWFEDDGYYEKNSETFEWLIHDLKPMLKNLDHPHFSRQLLASLVLWSHLNKDIDIIVSKITQNTNSAVKIRKEIVSWCLNVKNKSIFKFMEDKDFTETSFEEIAKMAYWVLKDTGRKSKNIRNLKT